jgi:hypothetical protein
MSRYLDTLPQPWTREVINTAILKSFTDARESIEETAGGRLWRSIGDLQDSLWIFQTSATQLLDEICVFEDRSRDPVFWQDVNSNHADAHARAVKRHIFNCTSSIMALVDHARAFQKKYPVVGYVDLLRESFSEPGLHSFLQGFRNYNTHWRIAEANWNIHHDFQTGKREARFIVSKPELLRWDGWCDGAKAYISNAQSHIDVYNVFSEYREHVQHFYSRHRGAVLDQYASAYQPYLEYKRLYEGLQKKYHWNMVLSHVPKTLNPYEYIGRYLTRRQAETLLALKHRSADQVDSLILMLGMNDFCDAALREKVLSLFKEAGDAVQPPPTNFGVGLKE